MIKDYVPSEYFPRFLNKQERDNPLVAIEDFFIFYSLPELRKKVRDNLYIVLSSKEIEALKNPVEIMVFYERLEKLFEANHILKLRYEDCKIMNGSFI